MKPVAAGTAQVDGEKTNEDVLALRAASTCRVPPELDNPVLLPDPVSPHIAAARAGGPLISPTWWPASAGSRCWPMPWWWKARAASRCRCRTRETGADLAEALGLPVVLVVGLRLGCLNHALLTAGAIRARGLTLAGWVANHVDPPCWRRRTTSPSCAKNSMRRCWPPSPGRPCPTRARSLSTSP
jgi:dethiobiotin synthetase